MFNIIVIEKELTNNKRIEKIIKTLDKECKVITGTNDCIFKSLFQDKGMKGILAEVIGYVLELSKAYVYRNLRFKPTELAKENFFEHGKTTDLLVEIIGAIINLEMNQDARKGGLIKNNGYHHAIAGKSLLKSEDFEESKKIVQINFDCINRFDDRIVIPFRLIDDEGKYILDENFINYHINMEKICEKYYNKEELNRFEKIMMILQEESKDQLRELSKGDSELMYMVKKLEEMSYDPEMVGLYDKERMDKLVEQVNIAEAKAVGIEQGLEQGSKQEKKEIARNLLKKKININVISEVTGLTIKEIENLK